MKPEFKEVKKQTRTYMYPETFNGPAHTLTVENVVSINVSKSGGHRLNTENGDKYYIKPGWDGIKFDAKEWSF